MFETTLGSVDVGLTTRNIGEMKRFYVDVLGLEEVAVRDIPGDFVKQAGFGGGDLRLQALKFGDILIKLLEWDGPPPRGDAQAGGVTAFADSR